MKQFFKRKYTSFLLSIAYVLTICINKLMFHVIKVRDLNMDLNMDPYAGFDRLFDGIGPLKRNHGTTTWFTKPSTTIRYNNQLRKFEEYDIKSPKAGSFSRPLVSKKSPYYAPAVTEVAVTVPAVVPGLTVAPSVLPVVSPTPAAPPLAPTIVPEPIIAKPTKGCGCCSDCSCEALTQKAAEIFQQKLAELEKLNIAEHRQEIMDLAKFALSEWDKIKVGTVKGKVTKERATPKKSIKKNVKSKNK